MATAIYSTIPQDMLNFMYKEPVTNKYKSKTSYINKSRDNASRPRYQLATKDDPRLRAPYGISKPFDEKQQDSDRKSLDMSIESESLLAVLKGLDQHNINVAFENCEKWFGKKLPREHITFMYRPLVTLDKAGKYKPTFRTKINTNASSDNATRFFMIEEADGRMVKYTEKDSSIVTKGSRLVPVVELGSLWFSSTQFGMTLECTEVIVFPNVQREEFPFQWGDSKAVPMDTDGNVHGAPEQDADSNPNDGYVPPQEPHDS